MIILAAGAGRFPGSRIFRNFFRYSKNRDTIEIRTNRHRNRSGADTREWIVAKTKKRAAEGSQPVHSLQMEYDVMVPMRDGVRLGVDITRPQENGKFPALLAISAYGKNLQRLSLTIPPQARPSALWDGGIEAGDIQYIVSRGYGHVVADVRGTGLSEGELRGFINNHGGDGDGKDIYDLVEWIAKQPWCNGNVGMCGISYFASVQLLGAAENPPHLKAIFCNGGHYDLYDFAYHGGILWLMPRAAQEGRGGDSGIAVRNVASRTKKELSPEEYKRRIEERLKDPDVRNWPNLVHVLNYPETHEAWLDFVLNPYDGPFYDDGNPISGAHKIKIPVYFQTKWGRGWVVDGTIEAFQTVKGKKKLDLQPLPPMQERPFHEFHEEMIRWYDHWLKGIDTGIMDEPTFRIFVEGSRQWRAEKEWPLARTEWTKFYLRPRSVLSTEAEALDTESAPPDGFYQAPLTVTPQVQTLVWKTAPMLEDVEFTGPGAFYLHASIDNDDTNFIVKIYDVDPGGHKAQIAAGYLKASHRELDEKKTTPWRPHHPHTRSIPIKPGAVNEYAIQIYSFSNVFLAGHRMQLELSSIEPFDDAHASLLPPDSQHLPSGRATTHKIFRDASHPSHLLLPLIPSKSMTAR